MDKIYSSLSWGATEVAHTHKIASDLALNIKPGVVIYLLGDLGAGKTTFVRGFLQALGYKGKVKSPTYTLVEPYDMPDYTVNHFDLYRIEDFRELAQIGLDEYFTEQSICLVEWPDKGQPVLPGADLTCYIDKIDAQDARIIRIDALSARGETVLSRL